MGGMLSRGTVVNNPGQRDWQRNQLLSSISSWTQVISKLDVNMHVMDTKIGEMHCIYTKNHYEIGGRK